MGKTYGGVLIHHKVSAQCQLMDAARRMVRWQRMVVVCVWGGGVNGGRGRGADTFELLCMTSRIADSNGRMRSVINLIYGP